MRRALPAVVVALALVTVAGAADAAAADGHVTVRRIDFGRYPTVRAIVAAPAGVRPSLTENGVPLRFAGARNLGSENAVVLAIDNSRSTAGRPLRDAVAAARSFIAQTQDRVAVESIGREPLFVSTSSWSKADALAALAVLRPDLDAGTALYDAVDLAVRRLRAQAEGSRVLIVLTDGRDLGSVTRLDYVVERAQAAGVVVYAIAVGHADRGALEQLAGATGGGLYDASDASRLAGAYAAIARDLGRVWQIAYPTTARRGETLRIEARGGGGSDLVSAAVPGAAGPPAPPLPHSFADARWAPAAVAAAAGLLLGLALLLLVRRPRPEAVRALVDAHLAPATAARRRGVQVGRLAAMLARLFDRTDRSLLDVRVWRWVVRSVEQSALPLRPAHLPYLAGAAALLLGFAAAVAGAPSGLVFLLLLVGLAVPFAIVHVVALRRRRAFDAQLPEMLAGVAGALRVGHGLRHALQAVAEDGTPPTSEEIARVLAEERLGRPLDEAILAMCERLGSDELEYVGTAITVQSQTGGSMASLFETVAETIRERQRHARKIRALTALGRTSAIVLVLMPLGLAALLTVLSPDYMRPLWQTSAGHVLIGLSIGSIAIGGVVLRRISSVDTA